MIEKIALRILVVFVLLSYGCNQDMALPGPTNVADGGQDGLAVNQHKLALLNSTPLWDGGSVVLASSGNKVFVSFAVNIAVRDTPTYFEVFNPDGSQSSSAIRLNANMQQPSFATPTFDKRFLLYQFSQDPLQGDAQAMRFTYISYNGTIGTGHEANELAYASAAAAGPDADYHAGGGADIAGDNYLMISKVNGEDSPHYKLAGSSCLKMGSYFSSGMAFVGNLAAVAYTTYNAQSDTMSLNLYTRNIHTGGDQVVPIASMANPPRNVCPYGLTVEGVYTRGDSFAVAYWHHISDEKDPMDEMVVTYVHVGADGKAAVGKTINLPEGTLAIAPSRDSGFVVVTDPWWKSPDAKVGWVDAAGQGNPDHFTLIPFRLGATAFYRPEVVDTDIGAAVSFNELGTLGGHPTRLSFYSFE